MGNFFSGDKNKGSGVSVAADPYGQVRAPLINYLSAGLSPSTAAQNQNFPQYQGQMVAPLSTAQNQSQKNLMQYANSSLNDNSTFQAGKSAINQMLNTTTDPSTSPYYQAIKAEANRNLGLTQQSVDNASAGGGRFWTGGRVQQQQQASSAAENSLNATLGNLALNEQQLKANILPTAQSYAATEQNYPLAQTAALQTYGALPQQYQQALDTALYNEWQAANYTRPDTTAQIAAAVQQPPLYQQNTSTPSPFSQVAGPLGTAAGFLLGGPAGAGIGGTIGNLAGGINSATNGSGVSAPISGLDSSTLSSLFPNYNGLMNPASGVNTAALNLFNPNGGMAPYSTTGISGMTPDQLNLLALTQG